MNTQKMAFGVVLFILAMLTLSTAGKWQTPKQFVLGVGMICLFGGTGILLFRSGFKVK